MVEQIAGGEDVAPGDFAAVGDDHTDDAPALQTSSRAREALLQLLDQRIDGPAEAAGFVDLAIRLRLRCGRDGAGDDLLAKASGWRAFGSGGAIRGALTHRVPHFVLTLLYRGLLAHAGVDDGLGGDELRAAAGPAAMLDAEDVEGKRLSAHGHDAVFANDAVLLAAADQLAGEQQERALAAIDEHTLIHGSAGVVLRRGAPLAAIADQAFRTVFGDKDLAAGETFFEGEEGASVLRTAHDREERNILVGDGIEDAPIAFGRRSSFVGARSGGDKGQASEGGKNGERGNQDTEEIGRASCRERV